MALRAGGELWESLKILNQLFKFYTDVKDFAALSYVAWALG